MNHKFKKKYRIESARLQSWDYGWNGYYFVTICTHGHKPWFGEIVDGKMVLSDIGELANKFWRQIHMHFRFTRLNVFVVMPNHVHGVFLIDKPNDGCSVRAVS